MFLFYREFAARCYLTKIYRSRWLADRRRHTITVLINPYISRVKLGIGSGIISQDYTRKTVNRSDSFVSDTFLIDSLIKLTEKK